MKITGKWKITEAELGGKPMPVAAFENLRLELDETPYQLIENAVIDSGIVEMTGDAGLQGLLITSLYGPNKGKYFIAFIHLMDKIC